MSEKNALVVYYSRTGTTAKLATAIAGALQCDMEEIADTKSRAGLLGWLSAGKDAFLRKETLIGTPGRDPASYGLVVIGTPVWAGTMSCAIRTYLSQRKGQLPEVAFFLTTGGSAIDQTFRHMEELCGKKPRACLGLRMKEVLHGDYGARLRQFVQALKE
jgi:flavodoxin